VPSFKPSKSFAERVKQNVSDDDSQQD
jgi:hypothetical protein